MNHREITDLIKRAAWTAGQAFFGAFIILAPGMLAAPNLQTARALVVSAMVAGIGAAASALKTFVLTYNR